MELMSVVSQESSCKRASKPFETNGHRGQKVVSEVVEQSGICGLEVQRRQKT
jgi:hypothetical protein